MRGARFALWVLVSSAGAIVASGQTAVPQPAPMPTHAPAQTIAPSPAPPIALGDASAVITRTCVPCHNDRLRSGNLSLAAFNITEAGAHAAIAEKMIRKLRAGQMPPAGSRRPDDNVLDGLVAALGAQVEI